MIQQIPTHKPIFGSNSTRKQPQPEPTGRNANIVTPEMIRKVEISILGLDNTSSPFSGYNSVKSNVSSASLASSRTYENPRENPAMQPFVKEIVQYEVNERYKMILERNSKLEEQLKQSEKKVEQMEASLSRSLADLQSQTSQQDIFEIMSTLSQNNNDQYEELSRQCGGMQGEVSYLQKYLNEDIKQQLAQTSETLQKKDQRVQEYLNAMEIKYEQKLTLIEQQLKVFSQSKTEGKDGQKLEGVDEMAVKRLEVEQLQVQDEISKLKRLLETNKVDYVQTLNQSVDEKMVKVRSDFAEMKQSISQLREEMGSKIENLNNSMAKEALESSRKKNETDESLQQAKILEQLSKTVQDLQGKRTSVEDVQKENRELKEKLLNFQLDTSRQMEEMRRLILSNPQIMMEASKSGFANSSTNDKKNYDQYDDIPAEFKDIYQDTNNGSDTYEGYQLSHQRDYQKDESSQQDLVEIATFGSMGDSKRSEGFNINAELDSVGKLNLIHSISFGDKDKTGGQAQDWHIKYEEHYSSINSLISKYDEMYSSVKAQEADIASSQNGSNINDDSVKLGEQILQQNNREINQDNREVIQDEIKDIPKQNTSESIILSGGNFGIPNSHENIIKNLTKNVEISQEIDQPNENNNIELTTVNSNNQEGKISKNLDENKENNNLDSSILNQEKGQNAGAQDYQPVIIADTVIPNMTDNNQQISEQDNQDKQLINVGVGEYVLEKQQNSNNHSEQENQANQTIPSQSPSPQIDEAIIKKNECPIERTTGIQVSYEEQEQSTFKPEQHQSQDQKPLEELTQTKTENTQEPFEVTVDAPVDVFMTKDSGEQNNKMSQNQNGDNSQPNDSGIYQKAIALQPLQKINSEDEDIKCESDEEGEQEGQKCNEQQQLNMKNDNLGENQQNVHHINSNNNEKQETVFDKQTEIKELSLQPQNAPVAAEILPAETTENTNNTVNENEVKRITASNISQETGEIKNENKELPSLINHDLASEQIKQTNLNESQQNLTLSQDKRMSASNNSSSSVPQQEQSEEEEIVYQLDDNGYLMDEKGNYILGDDGEMVKLGEDDIQYLRQTNILEEY